LLRGFPLTNAAVSAIVPQGNEKKMRLEKERHAFEKERWEREYQLQELRLRDQLALEKERLEIEKQSKQDKKAFLKQLLEQKAAPSDIAAILSAL
jgi:hypothetical protein